MIELRDVRKIYSRRSGETVTALDGVCLRIERGEFIAIVGGSGSGKSTLMNLLGLLDAPTEGSYLFEGRNVAGLNPDEQARFRNRKVGFVFQAFHLMARTSALDNVELPLLYAEQAPAKGAGARALEAVGLADRMRHTPAELSGGQQQRVAIARALVNEPDLILADEPTGNLDPHAAREIMSILQSLSSAGRTVVLVTHDPQMAAHCRRIARIEAGRIVADERKVESRQAAGVIR